MDALTLIFCIYVALGAVLVIANGYCLYVLLRRPILLRRYCVILVQLIATVANGIAMLTSGIARLIIQHIDYTTPTSKRICMFAPWNLLFVWAEPLEATSLLLLSTDRFFAVFTPILYFRKHYTIEITQIAVCVTAIIVYTFASWVFSWLETEPIVSPMCWTSKSQNPFFVTFGLVVTIGASAGSVLLYIVVYVKARSLRKTIKTQSVQASVAAFERRQLKLTRTMCVSCVMTTIFYVVPSCIRFIFSGKVVQITEFVTAYRTISCSINPFAVIMTIFVLQEDIRQAAFDSLPQSSLNDSTLPTAVGSPSIFESSSKAICPSGMRQLDPFKRSVILSNFLSLTSSIQPRNRCIIAAILLAIFR
ncbi:unnamed protein product [Gongylonema pulchrum]|uniref:G_PROTEIN_RECEP_F1_2 domain-containing protein n=1 Tax=Gongylonema pulchrum TaxID=637853 RepID=A0A183CUG9_9BILA|nr:unnamed protein product [Gongylonema pulchrum]